MTARLRHLNCREIPTGLHSVQQRVEPCRCAAGRLTPWDCQWARAWVRVSRLHRAPESLPWRGSRGSPPREVCGTSITVPSHKEWPRPAQSGSASDLRRATGCSGNCRTEVKCTRLAANPCRPEGDQAWAPNDLGSPIMSIEVDSPICDRARESLAISSSGRAIPRGAPQEERICRECMRAVNDSGGRFRADAIGLSPSVAMRYQGWRFDPGNESHCDTSAAGGSGFDAGKEPVSRAVAGALVPRLDELGVRGR